MNINDYKFEVGDTVITTDGRTGKITDICKCVECAARGFYEPIWNRDDGEGSVYITQVCAEIGFPEYYQIGSYRFNDFVKDGVLCEMAIYEAELTRLKNQLKVIEETETKECDNKCDYAKTVKENKELTNNAIIFPQTIGDITYYSKEELFEWVKNQQTLNKERIRL